MLTGPFESGLRILLDSGTVAAKNVSEVDALLSVASLVCGAERCCWGG